MLTKALRTFLVSRTLADISINLLRLWLLLTNVKLTNVNRLKSKDLAEQDRLCKHIYSYSSYLNNNMSSMYNNVKYVSYLKLPDAEVF